MANDVLLDALAAKIRKAYVEAAIGAYEDAATNGLCAQGAWECAVDALRHLDVRDLLVKEGDRITPQSVDDQISSRLPSGSRR